MGRVVPSNPRRRPGTQVLTRLREPPSTHLSSSSSADRRSAHPLAAQAPRERPLSGAENNTFPTILTVALSARPQRVSSGEPAHVQPATGWRCAIQPSGVVSRIRPAFRRSAASPPQAAGLDMDVSPGDRTGLATDYSKPRPCREAATSPTGIEELRMTTEQQVRTVRAAGENGAIRPFRVDIPDESLEDLRQRIAATRLPSEELVEDRSQGVQLATIQELVTYWVTDYDLGRMEARLNALPQFTTEIDGVNIHFIHVRSPHENALPLIMTHGWPGSVVEMIDSVGPLTDPTAHGGSAEDAFHLVLPSLPGYGFSGEPAAV